VQGAPFSKTAPDEFPALPSRAQGFQCGLMTDQFTSLSPAALRDIIAKIDESLAVFERHSGRLHATEFQAKNMLLALRARMMERLQNHPESDN
jgi:hypothetical protein